MAKHGQRKHKKRIAVPKHIAISNKKEYTFFSKAKPGPYKANESIPLNKVLIEFLGLAKTAKEAKRIIKEGKIKIDGKTVREERYPVGLMAIITAGKDNYQIVIEKGKLLPKPIESTNEKMLKIVNKWTAKKGQIMVMAMDGRNIKADNHIKVGDSVVYDLKEKKIKKHLKFDKGARCLVTAGKHAGTIGTLKEVYQHGRKKDALLNTGDEDIITRADYLMVVE